MLYNILLLNYFFLKEGRSRSFLMNPRYENPGNKDKRYSQCPQDAAIFEIHQTTKERCTLHPVSFRHFLIGEVTALDQTSHQRK